MHPHIAAEPDFVAMFLDEARLAARVRHPNVVPTIDVHEDPLFLVMDCIEGPSLHTVRASSAGASAGFRSTSRCASFSTSSPACTRPTT